MSMRPDPEPFSKLVIEHHAGDRVTNQMWIRPPQEASNLCPACPQSPAYWTHSCLFYLFPTSLQDKPHVATTQHAWSMGNQANDHHCPWTGCCAECLIPSLLITRQAVSLLPPTGSCCSHCLYPDASLGPHRSCECQIPRLPTTSGKEFSGPGALRAVEESWGISGGRPHPVTVGAGGQTLSSLQHPLL